MGLLSKMNPTLRTIIICAVTFVVAAAVCITALIVSATVNPDTIINSIRHDAAKIEQRGDYPIVIGQTGTPKYRYDGFTDSLMLLQAIPDRSQSALDNAVLGPYYAIGDGTPGGDGTGGVSPTAALLELVDDPSIEQQRSYVLYWHGYVVPLRALLTIMSPTNIITLNCALFALLAVLVFEAFRRTGGLTYALAFLAALIITFSWITPLGFQFFTTYLIAFLATLVLSWMLQSAKRLSLIVPFFLTVGLLTAFFDFLTTPLLTFLLPLSLYLLWRVTKARERSITLTFSDSFRKIVSVGMSWLVGYAGFWASKWLMTAIVYSAKYATDEFAYALSQRSGIQDGASLQDRVIAIYNNLYQLFAAHPDGSIFMGEFFLIAFAVIAALAALWWLLVKKSNTSAQQIKESLPMLLVAAGPYVWYFMVAQHSTFHSWFTWRLQTASLLAVAFFILLSVNWSGLRKRT